MIVVDSSALVAIMFDEPEADRFVQVIAKTGSSLMSAVSMLETSMVVCGRSGRASPWTRLDLFVSSAGIQIVAHDRDLAFVAREAFFHYGKGRHKAALNMGDCASYALAESRNLPLLFKGQDFARTDLVPAG